MNCQAIIEDYNNPAYQASMQRIVVPSAKACSYKARVKLGDLCLCNRHAKLAKEGLLRIDGVMVGRADRQAVRRYPEKYPNGLVDWAANLEPEPLP